MCAQQRTSRPGSLQDTQVIHPTTTIPTTTTTTAAAMRKGATTMRAACPAFFSRPLMHATSREPIDWELQVGKLMHKTTTRTLPWLGTDHHEICMASLPSKEPLSANLPQWMGNQPYEPWNGTWCVCFFFIFSSRF